MLRATAGTGMIGCGSYHQNLLYCITLQYQYQKLQVRVTLPACGGDILYQITLITVRYHSLVTFTRLNLFGIVLVSIY